MDNYSETNTVEFLKSVSEHFKHLTTVCSGFIIVMVAILEKIIQAASWKWLAIASFPFFFMSILFSLIAQVYFIDYIKRPLEFHKYDDHMEKPTVGFSLAAWLTFLFGVLFIVIFSIRNMFA